jgi:hypothetical protein
MSAVCDWRGGIDRHSVRPDAEPVWWFCAPMFGDHDGYLQEL